MAQCGGAKIQPQILLASPLAARGVPMRGYATKQNAGPAPKAGKPILRAPLLLCALKSRARRSRDLIAGGK